MRVMHIALGGCLRPPPVPYGLTEDTGGHIAYILGAAMAQAARPEIAAVEIVTRAFDDPRLGACHAMPREEVAPGCTILRLRTARGAYLAKEDLEDELPALTEAFLRLLADQAARPDVLHAHFADAAILARAASQRFGIPWLHSSHSLALEKAAGQPPGPALARRIAREQAALRQADAVIASSRDEAERQIPAYDPAAEGRVHRVSPGVTTPAHGDPARARRLIAPFLREPDKPIVLAIARPIPKKNLAALIEAYGGSPELQDRANLVILAGLRDGLTGPEGVVAELFDAVDRHDLWGRVALPRRHEAADVAGLYALAARGGVFANPAHHEPFGLTVIEAARADVPVVATRNGGPADILRRLRAGELVDPADPADIAAGLLRVLTDPQRGALAAAAGRRARALYDWDVWAERVSQICAELATPGPERASSTPTRLLACDIDGTLTGDRTAAARFAAWHARRPRGLGFAVATGRGVVEARRVLADWGLPRPDVLVTSVGTEIWRWSGGALALCEDFARHMEAGWHRAEVEAALAPLGLSPQPAHDQRRWKLSYFGTPGKARRAARALVRAGLAARVVHSHGHMIDVLAPNGGKAAALGFEATRLGLSPSDVIVAGDSGNDADMLEAFAAAILPANASPDLARLGGPWRSALPHADGVLDGLARLGLASRAGEADPARIATARIAAD